MTHQTASLSSFDEYLLLNYLSDTEKAEQIEDRSKRLARYPYSVILTLAFPEVDFANRWCWQNFGPEDGECHQYASEYPACSIKGSHHHLGSWMSYWIEKTEYNFGFNEWCFRDAADRDSFLKQVPLIHWGENFPKTIG